MSSFLLLPAVVLFWKWNQETPTPKRESGVGNGEKITPHNIILPHCQTESVGVQVNLIYIWCLLTSLGPISFIFMLASS